MRRLKKIRIAIVIALCTIAFLAWTAVFDVEAHRDLLRVTVFDVGQGDSIFIEMPKGAQMLVDGGPDADVLNRLGGRMPYWDRSIDVLVLTHPHADHVAGALEVLKRYDVGLIIESGVNYSTAEYKDLEARIKEKNIPVHIAAAGDTIDFGDGVRFDVLAPLQLFAGDSPKNVHDSMVVGKLVFASTSVLLTGDAEASLEYQMLYAGEDVSADVLKVGHHGSKTSTSDIFLGAVDPDAAIISVGRKNRYGHPYQEVLDRLASFGAKVFRTDTAGDITVTTDGQTIGITAEH